MKEYTVDRVELGDRQFDKGAKCYSEREFLNIEQVLEIIREYKDNTKKEKIMINGRQCSIGSERLKTYLKGTECVKCGKVSVFFSLEIGKGQHDKPHLNLYCLNTNNGKIMMMTKDHIYPRSLGGADSLENYQPMCMRCNCKKGSKVPKAD